MHSSRALGTILAIVAGAVLFTLRTPQASSVCSRFGSAAGLENRFSRLGSPRSRAHQSVASNTAEQACLA
eukprot:9798114-Alexandrium_andersonii.AAC.1